MISEKILAFYKTTYKHIHSIIFVLSFLIFLSNKSGEAFVNIDDAKLPEEFGKISHSFQGKSQGIVFLLSDIHNNFEAQKSVAKIIDFLINYYDVQFVGIEGAHGTVDTFNLKKYYNKDAKDAVCSYYMKQGYFGGAVYKAITSDYNFLLHGVEDQSLYSQILKVYRDTFERRKEVLEQIELLRDILKRFRNNAFSPELLDLELSFQDYNDGKLSMTHYCNVLLQLCIKLDIKLTTYPNMLLLKDIKVIEDKIDFSKINIEEQKFIESLKEAIGKELNDLSLLNTSTQKLNSKRISEEEYYDIIHLLSKKYKISLSDFENIWLVIKSSSVLRKIDKVKLYEESKRLYPIVQNKLLLQNPRQEVEELIKLSQSIDKIDRIVSLAALKRDVDSYFDAPHKYSTSRFIRFIREYALDYDVGYRINPKIVLIDKIYPLLGEFYKLSHKRSESLGSSFIKKFETEPLQRAILVVGKFHIEEVMNNLKRNNITFVTINPYISRLKGDISLTPLLLGTGEAIRTFLEPLAMHLKPWIVLSPSDGQTGIYFQHLLDIEFVVQDLYKRVKLIKNQLNDKIITREIYKLKNNLMMKNNLSNIYPIRIIRLNMLDKYFIEVEIQAKDELLRILIEPLEERELSYADYTVSQITPLKDEQLERGIYRSSDRLISILKSEYNAEVYNFDEKYISEIKKEIIEEKVKVRRDEMTTLPQVMKPDISSKDNNIIKISDEEAVKEKLDAIDKILKASQKENSLDILNDFQIKFIILKSQLSFYALKSEVKKYIQSVEGQIKSKIDIALREFEETEAKKKQEREALRKKEESERRLKFAKLQKEKRKVIDEIIGNIYILKKKVDSARNFVTLNEIEKDFNDLIGKLTITDLNKEDRIILNAFKVAWETKYTLLKDDIEKKGEEKLKVIKGTDIASSEYLKQAFVLKELVDAATLPEDAEFILGEYNKLKNKKDFTMLSENEKAFFDGVGDYIQDTLTKLKTGGGIRRLSLLKSSLDTKQIKEEIPSIEKSFADIYTIRNKAIMMKSVEELKLLEKEFMRIDQNLRKNPLEQHQKEILADTERIIKQSIRRLIIKAESKLEKDRKMKELKVRRERESFLKEILGERDSGMELKKKILFIEDNEFERNIVKKRLEQEGYEIESLDRYEIPINLFSDNKIDLILLDDDIIGNTTGIDFIDTLKLQEKDLGIYIPPIILHTNNSLSYAYDFLKRKGITKKDDVFVISKRDLNENISFINRILYN